MATREVSEWSVTDASNNFPADEGGHVELMKRSDVNDANRANMGSMRRWYDDPEWLDLTVGASLTKFSATLLKVLGGNFTQYFTTDRRVRITESSGGPTFATVVSSEINGGDTDVTLKDFTSPESATEIPADLLLVTLHITKDMNPSVFRDDIFVTVTTLTGEAIQEAIDTLEGSTVNGGIIILEPDAIYVIDETLVIGDDGVNPGNIRIMGRGAILQAGATLDDEILDIRDVTLGAIDAQVLIENVIFDGNATNQTGTTDVGLLNIGEDTSFVWLRNCLFDDSFGHGLTIKTSSNNIWVDSCIFKDCGEDGIFIEDSDSDLDRVYIRACTFDNPSARSGFTTGSGIRFAGNVTISDCQFINLDHATDLQVGITCETKTGASPTDESAHESTITGCRFEGTGLNARGVWLRGRQNVVSACTFNFTGTGSGGVHSDDTGGSQAETNFHTISGCTFLDVARAVRFFPSAEDCLCIGCVFESCPNPYTDAGIRNTFNDNSITNCDDGVRLDSTAQNPMINGNRIDTCTDDGIEIIAGVIGVQLGLNVITNASGSEIADGGTATVIADKDHLFNLIMEVQVGDAVQLNLDDLNVELAIPETAVKFELFADGVRAWSIKDLLLRILLEASIGDEDLEFRLRIGPNRLIDVESDDQLGFDALDQLSYDPGDTYTVNFGITDQQPFRAVVPALNDEIYVTGKRVSGGAGTDIQLTCIEKGVLGTLALGCYFRVELRPEDRV